MTDDEMNFSNLTHTLHKIFKAERVLFISGQPGSSKTFTALQFCAEHKDSIYFLFKILIPPLHFGCSATLIPIY
ncbi:hypothetical protein D7X94_17790 [Acutalibacter sp. 1XD8-33]|nr:hypothetical protein D7X94_17790 [Acutalibacter sp. 1XD8-33]